jgi:hypothetical protein
MPEASVKTWLPRTERKRRAVKRACPRCLKTLARGEPHRACQPCSQCRHDPTLHDCGGCRATDCGCEVEGAHRAPKPASEKRYLRTDERHEVIELAARGLSSREIATRMKCTHRTVNRIRREYRERNAQGESDA